MIRALRAHDDHRGLLDLVTLAACAGKAGTRLEAERRAARLTRLGELNRKARRGQATPDEIAEIERLEAETLTSGQ